MAFEATKRDGESCMRFSGCWADGYVYGGTPDVKKNEALPSSRWQWFSGKNMTVRVSIFWKNRPVHLKGRI